MKVLMPTGLQRKKEYQSKDCLSTRKDKKPILPSRKLDFEEWLTAWESVLSVRPGHIELP